MASDDMIIEMNREMIDVTSAGPEPDPGWRYTDKAGHKHLWQDGYPTLIEIDDERYWCADCGDEHVDSHLECPICHQEITPGTRSPTTRFIPGPATYTLNGERITKERYDELVAPYIAD